MFGITCLRMGQFGLSGSIRLKKCGVIDRANLFPDNRTPLRSSSLRVKCLSNPLRFVILFLSCQLKLFHSDGFTIIAIIKDNEIPTLIELNYYKL